MKINMDKAKVNLNLHKLINEIDIIVEDKTANTAATSKKNANLVKTSASKNQNLKNLSSNSLGSLNNASLADNLLKPANAKTNVRGTNGKNNSHLVEIIAASSLAMLAFATLKRKDIEKLKISKLGNNSHTSYININLNTQTCLINNYEIKDFKVIVLGQDNKFYDFENLKNFDINEINEIIFVEIDNNEQFIREIRSSKNNWNKENINKYINIF